MNKYIVSLMVFLSCVSTHATSSEGSDIDHLIAALIKVESGGNDRAIGDRHMTDWAYGPLQIRKPCVDDVNAFCKTSYTSKDMLGNRELSVWLFKKYLSRYATAKRLGHKPTLEDMARIWNGGPNGWKNSSTLKYWSKVRQELNKK